MKIKTKVLAGISIFPRQCPQFEHHAHAKGTTMKIKSKVKAGLAPAMRACS